MRSIFLVIKRAFVCCLAAILLVIGAVTCDVNVDSLFHGAPPPQAAPAQPAPGKEGEFATQGADVAIPNLDVFENFVPYASSRHDEFDWALTKVNI